MWPQMTLSKKDFIHLIHNAGGDRLVDLAGEALMRYFRVHIYGQKYIPRKGRAILAPNHSGFAGLDVFVLRHFLKHTIRRNPSILAHRAYFDIATVVGMLSESFGLRPATVASGNAELLRNELLIVFPEGENGNFKSTRERYSLQEFHSGFVRMAIMTRAPVVPCLIVGAEESSLNLGNIDLSRYVKHLVVPLPLNILPLPTRWRIRFFPPVSYRRYKRADADDLTLVHDLAQKLRNVMQETLNASLRRRRSIF